MQLLLCKFMHLVPGLTCEHLGRGRIENVEKLGGVTATPVLANAVQSSSLFEVCDSHTSIIWPLWARDGHGCVYPTPPIRTAAWPRVG
jgi:hypothetical protein